MATLTAESRPSTSAGAGSHYRRFRPRLVLGYQQDLQSLIEELTAMRTAEARVVLDSAIENFLQALDEWRIHVLNFLRTPNMFGPMKVLARQKAIEFRDRYPDVGGALDQPAHGGGRVKTA